MTIQSERGEAQWIRRPRIFTPGLTPRTCRPGCRPRRRAVINKIAWRILRLATVAYSSPHRSHQRRGRGADDEQGPRVQRLHLRLFGAGIFFLGYFIFELPSNVILERVGARRWIARSCSPGNCLPRAPLSSPEPRASSWSVFSWARRRPVSSPA